MTLDEMSRVMAAVAVFEYRFGSPNLDVLQAWHSVLADLDVNDAVEAVRRYYAVHTDRIMPGHIRAGVKEIQAERRRAQPSEVRALPSRFEDPPERQFQIEQGAASVREVLGPVLAHLAAKSPPPSALDELRELTPGPADTLVDGEAQP